MIDPPKMPRPFFVYSILSVTILTSGCASRQLSHPLTVNQLKAELVMMVPEPRPAVVAEADKLARTTFTIIETSSRRDKMIGWPWANNGLIRMGMKSRGLCYHWAEDLVTALDTVHPKFYEIHWMVARKGKLREHNSALLTAKGNPVEQGLIIDPWRTSGRPFWIRMAQDKYLHLTCHEKSV